MSQGAVTDDARPRETYVDLINRYWDKNSPPRYHEARGILHGVYRATLAPQLIPINLAAVIFVTVGSEVDPREPDPELRKEARGILVRSVFRALTWDRDPSTIVLCLEFFGRTRKHTAGFDTRDLESLRKFIRMWCRDAEPLLIARAAVNAEYCEILADERFIPAIGILYESLRNELVEEECAKFPMLQHPFWTEYPYSKDPAIAPPFNQPLFEAELRGIFALCGRSSYGHGSRSDVLLWLSSRVAYTYTALTNPDA